MAMRRQWRALECLARKGQQTWNLRGHTSIYRTSSAERGSLNESAALIGASFSKAAVRECGAGSKSFGVCKSCSKEEPHLANRRSKSTRVPLISSPYKKTLHRTKTGNNLLTSRTARRQNAFQSAMRRRSAKAKRLEPSVRLSFSSVSSSGRGFQRNVSGVRSSVRTKEQRIFDEQERDSHT
jgi:hypothetical protein